MSARLLVIDRCGVCGWCDRQSGFVFFCGKALEAGSSLTVNPHLPPPDWCPLPKADEVADVGEDSGG